jgi:hypothetical protein
VKVQTAPVVAVHLLLEVTQIVTTAVMVVLEPRHLIQVHLSHTQAVEAVENFPVQVHQEQVELVAVVTAEPGAVLEQPTLAVVVVVQVLKATTAVTAVQA